MATEKKTGTTAKKPVPKGTSTGSKGFLTSLSKVRKSLSETYRRKPKLILTWALIGLVVLGIISFFWFNKGLLLAGRINGRLVTSIEFYNKLTKVSGDQTFDAIVRETLIAQEARKKNITASDQEVDGKLAQIEKRLGGKENLDAAISQNNTTLEEVRRQLYLQVLLEKILADKINVTDEEVAKYSAENKDLVADMSKEEVKDQLKSDKLNQELGPWLEEVKKNANIQQYF